MTLPTEHPDHCQHTHVVKSETPQLSLQRREMAESKLQLDSDAFSCPICLELLNDPVTIPCGHSYCMSCVQNHWDREDEDEIYSCPQCRQSFDPRPVLVKNTMLVALMDQLKKSGLQTAPVARCTAKLKDVACDVCIGMKLKAVKSCVQCVASYCETHLQPHYQSDALRKHRLMAPSESLQENICSEHNEVKKMFCRTDQQLLCVVCSMDQQHKGHCVVTAGEERAERQVEVEARRDHVELKIRGKETDLEKLQQEAQALRSSADEAMKITVESFTGLIHLVQKEMYEVERQIRTQQEAGEAQVQKHWDELQRDVNELKRTKAELDALALTPDHNLFLHKYGMLSKESTSTPDLPKTEKQPMQLFDQLTITVIDLTDQLKLTLTEVLAKISPATHDPPPQPDPTTRADFLKYACQVTLDSYTAHPQILLSEGDRRATLVEEDQQYPDHPDRFTYYWQVLSREGLTGRCYWEVEWSGSTVEMTLAYKSIKRKGDSDECVFGLNDKSWALRCDKTGYLLRFDKVQSQVLGPVSSRIGVYLDHSAGVVCFYSISDSMTLLHRVQTKFTQPLHVGLRFYWGLYFTKDTAHFLTLK